MANKRDFDFTFRSAFTKRTKKKRQKKTESETNLIRVSQRANEIFSLSNFKALFGGLEICSNPVHLTLRRERAEIVRAGFDCNPVRVKNHD